MNHDSDAEIAIEAKGWAIPSDPGLSPCLSAWLFCMQKNRKGNTDEHSDCRAVSDC